jgi:DNA-binding LacI/PurR family transcriptional regulator
MSNIETIAQKADVSIATVSRTLRNPENLKTDNQRRIIKVARQVGYDFSKRKKSVLSQKTKQVVFLSFSKDISPETLHADGTYLPIVNGINNVIGEKGYNLVVSDVGIGEKPPPSLLRNDVDGVIFHGRMSSDFFEKYIEHLPHVGIQHYNPCLKCNWVMTDQWDISFQAVEYLYKIGHRRIAFLADFVESYPVQERYRGYQDALKYFNLPSDQNLALCWQRPRVNGIVPLEHELPDYSSQINQLMDRKSPPTAIICLGDFRANAAIRALNKRGLSVPENVSVIGAHSEITMTNITGFCSNLSFVCSYAAQFIMELINGKHKKNMKIMIQPTLSIGTSTNAIKPE